MTSAAKQRKQDRFLENWKNNTSRLAWDSVTDSIILKPSAEENRKARRRAKKENKNKI